MILAMPTVRESARWQIGCISTVGMLNPVRDKRGSTYRGGEGMTCVSTA